MRTGGLNEILKTLLDNDYKGISNQELICLLQKIENDATEIYHAKYGLDEKIKFIIDCDNTSNANLIGRQSAKSLQCIRQSIKKNLDLSYYREGCEDPSLLSLLPIEIGLYSASHLIRL